MKYVQTTPEGVFTKFLDINSSVALKDTQKSVRDLTEEEKLESNIYPLVPSPWPVFDPRSHWLREVTPELVNSEFIQKWQVLELPSEQSLTNFNTAKSNKRNLINTWRANANQTYFIHNGKTIACDSLSRSDIDAVAGSISLTGAFPVGFPPAWKAIDNSYSPLPDVAAFKAMYNSMTLQGTINFGKSQSLKTALEAATTLAEVDAVVWV